MNKGRYFWVVFVLLFSAGATASLRPFVTASIGVDNVLFTSNQNIIITSPYHNTYYGSNRYNDFAGGLFAGVEGVLTQHILGQVGLSYYQNTSYQARGNINQFGDSTFDNFKYQFNVNSKRIFVETKWLTMLASHYHPFFNLGIGESINHADRYTETPVSSADVPMTPGFQDRTTHSLAYLVGVGVDMDVADHIRCGVLYRFVSLGGVRLNTTPLSDTGDLLKSNNLNVNEFFMQFTYLG